MSWNNLVCFFGGFAFCVLVFFSLGSNLEFPFSTGFGVFDGEVGVPSDYIVEEDIVVLDDRVILRVSGVTLSRYADTGSMRPFLDKGANGIRVVPEGEDDVEVGDIVSFRSMGRLIVHRVVEKGWDEEGVWFEVKGDANLVSDGKIRFSDIEYKTIGVLY